MVPKEKSQTQPAILVVEDEPMLLAVVSETLREAGYAVWEARNGDEALGIMKARPDICFLLTDVKMPGMSGYQLADASLALSPQIKVLLMTGYAQEPVPKKVTDAGIELLQKPFDFDELPGLVGRILARD